MEYIYMKYIYMVKRQCNIVKIYTRSFQYYIPSLHSFISCSCVSFFLLFLFIIHMYNITICTFNSCITILLHYCICIFFHVPYSCLFNVRDIHYLPWLLSNLEHTYYLKFWKFILYLKCIKIILWKSNLIMNW